jgi:ribosomal protein L11 methyltransferase
MTKRIWEEVSILVDQEFAEAVAGALSGIIPGGIVQERIYGSIFPEELHQEVGPVKVYGYLPIDNQLDQRRERIKQALYYLGRISSIPEPSFSQIEEKDWTKAWQERYQPIPLGSKLIVVPSWLKNPNLDRIAISIDPTMAFGSGTHPSTQLSLILLEEVITRAPVAEMIDIGCGTGILSIAAAKLGVNHVIGVDIDPEAIMISLANARDNQVHEKTSFFQGSIDEIHQGSFGITRAPLVVANIIAPILTRLFENDLIELLVPGGSLVLSGILEEQLQDFICNLDKYPLEIQSQQKQGEWVALLCVRIID